MAKKDQLIVGVDIGSHAVKICQLQRIATGYKLLSVGSANIPPGAVEDGVLQDPEEVGKVILSLLKNLKIKNTKIGISISGYSVIVKKIKIEKFEDIDIDEYVKSEAEQYIPFDVDDVYLDYQVLKNDADDGRIEIMLVAAKKEVINEYLSMLSGLRLKTTLVDVDGFALENIWEYFSGNHENVVLVDIGASKMNINIIADGFSVLARDIVVGSDQLTEQIANTLGVDFDFAERVKIGVQEPGDDTQSITDIFNQTCTQWVLEIKKAIDLYFANNPDKPLKTMVLSGGGSKVNGLAEFIHQETGMLVHKFNPFEKISYDTNKFDPVYLQLIAPEMAIAAGLAIRQSSI